MARRIARDTPKGNLLYGLGIGKPEEIVGCVDLGYHLFDCVLPTRDARHKRLYVFNADSIEKINVRKDDFYSYYVPDKQKAHVLIDGREVVDIQRNEADYSGRESVSIPLRLNRYPFR